MEVLQFQSLPRVLSILEMRRAASLSDWIFPGDTRSGHIETGTLKKQQSERDLGISFLTT